MRVLEGPGNESRGYPTWILVRSQRDPEKKSQGESGQIQDGSQINPGRIPARSQIKTRQIPNISCMDPAQSQFNYRQIPVRLQRDSKKLFQGLRADPRKIPKRKSQLDPPEKTPKGFRTDRKKIPEKNPGICLGKLERFEAFSCFSHSFSWTTPKSRTSSPASKVPP